MRAVAAAIVLCGTATHASPVALDEGELEADVTVEVSLATSPFARPTSVAPDLWLGVTRHLTIGLIHSHASVDQIDAGATFCVRTADLGCDRFYRGSGLDARYVVYEDDTVAIVPRARFLVRDIDPWKPAATLGALARWHRGRLAVASDPYLQLGLANRDAGNRTQLWLPVYVEVTVACAWRLALHTGWNAELVNARDAWHVPVALAARATLSANVELRLEAGFSTLLGPQNNIKQRAAMLTLAFRGHAL